MYVKIYRILANLLYFIAIFYLNFNITNFLTAYVSLIQSISGEISMLFAYKYINCVPILDWLQWSNTWTQ